ncbi:hypothetical protein JNB88_13625 [Rhizobium cauense]|uniref:hypothetical protein n=1 Tax=Rhizobium cauense TaxID=1166683 RepID=UPI001C6ECF24|nr:hypothetical protein [Rhizobium cauense]MBW9114685.1 hypothetical protein [Rhizobium cauense]
MKIGHALISVWLAAAVLALLVAFNPFGRHLVDRNITTASIPGTEVPLEADTGGTEISPRLSD